MFRALPKAGPPDEFYETPDPEHASTFLQVLERFPPSIAINFPRSLSLHFEKSIFKLSPAPEMENVFQYRTASFCAEPLALLPY
jgi:hypothetical protein